MKLLIVAVGQRVPDWAQTACNDYAKRLPPELKLELKAVKTEPRAGKTLASLLAAERGRIEAAIPRGAQVVALDERASPRTSASACRTCPCPTLWCVCCSSSSSTAPGRSMPGTRTIANDGGAHWSTFAFGCGMSAFGRPGGAHARLGGGGMFHGCCKIGPRQLRCVATSSPRSSKSVDVCFHLPDLPKPPPPPTARAVGPAA